MLAGLGWDTLLVRFPVTGGDCVPTRGDVTGTWGWGWLHHCVPAGTCRLPRTKKGAPWGKSWGCAGIDHRSRNQHVVATAMAGTETATGRHVGGTCVLVKGSGNVRACLNGTACSGVDPLPLNHLWVRGRGREVLPPPHSRGAWARETRPGRTDVWTRLSLDLC